MASKCRALSCSQAERKATAVSGVIASRFTAASISALETVEARRHWPGSQEACRHWRSRPRPEPGWSAAHSPPSGRKERPPNRRERSVSQQGGDAAEGNRRSGGRRSRHGGNGHGLLTHDRHVDDGRIDLHRGRDLGRGILAVPVSRRGEHDRKGHGRDDGPKGDNQLFRGHKQIQRTDGREAIH